MTVKNYLESTYNPSDEYAIRKPIVCADGFFVSIQGGTHFHYCTPRKHCNEYETVELGFPSAKDNYIMEYAEDPSDPTGTVYGWVPIDLVETLIEKHGGIIGKIERIF